MSSTNHYKKTMEPSSDRAVSTIGNYFLTAHIFFNIFKNTLTSRFFLTLHRNMLSKYTWPTKYLYIIFFKNKKQLAEAGEKNKKNKPFFRTLKNPWSLFKNTCIATCYTIFTVTSFQTFINVNKIWQRAWEDIWYFTKGLSELANNNTIKIDIVFQ